MPSRRAVAGVGPHSLVAASMEALMGLLLKVRRADLALLHPVGLEPLGRVDALLLVLLEIRESGVLARNLANVASRKNR